MWMSFSVLLTILMLVLSLRFYCSHCLPSSDGRSNGSATASLDDSNRTSDDSTNWNAEHNGTPPVLR